MYSRNQNNRGRSNANQQGPSRRNNKRNDHRSRSRDAVSSYQHADSGKKKFTPRQPGQRLDSRPEREERMNELETPSNQFRLDETGKRVSLRVTPDVAYNEERLKRVIADEMRIDVRTINALRIRKRSIDARQRTIYVNLTLDTYINEMPPQLDFEPVRYQDVSRAPRVIVVGAGPGGLFAALRLIELGKRPIVLERGKDVHERRKDIARISREHKVDAESNYSFGEGELVLTLTANSIRVRRSVATSKRYYVCSASLVLRPTY